MSYTEIYMFNKAGTARLYAQIRNAWRGAMAIWCIMEEKHLPPYRPSYIPPNMTLEEFSAKYYKPRRTSATDIAAMQEIWDLVDNPAVPVHERIVLFTTLDKCLVKKQDLLRVIDAFNRFEGETSLKEQADVLTRLLNDKNCIAVGWNQTSVAANSWSCYRSDEKGNCIPYNCLKQSEHYWLFDELVEQGGEAAKETDEEPA